jgi:predicted glycogen debranching enzyme
MKKSIYEIMNHEYLMTNGLGGYSFSTLDQVNCRKYHSLYTVSYNPPIERMHLISKMEEVFEVAGQRYPLTYENVTGNPETQTHFTAYKHEGVINQTFQLKTPDVFVTRTLAMAYGTNLLAVRYEIETKVDTTFNLIPWFNFRDHHDAETANVEDYRASYDVEARMLLAEAKGKSVYLKVEGVEEGDLSFEPRHENTAECYYPIETQRGYPDKEAHVILGAFTIALPQGKHVVDVLVNIASEFQPADAVFTNRIVRYEQLMERAGATASLEDATLRRLVQAADDFIVYRKTTGKMSIIAGYPWFSDWGRDTMISIPGLTLATGRDEEALQMIEGFIDMAYMGIIPNNFPDEGEAPMYNTSDGTLWLFNAVNAYYEATGNLDAIRRLYPKLMQILNHHLQGTINDIFMDTDGLLSSGNEMTQLTWMDVKVNGWVVTPRHGKAVEINALWYNALAIMNKLTKLLNIGNEAMEVDFEALLKQVKASFNDAFWNAKDQNLYDLVIDGEPVDIPRPNMIFAVSLPYPVLEERHWKAVVNYVTKHFKVPYGLLTLRREDKNFNKTYEGDLLSRDGAYHRGTAWGWLIGPYLEAHLKTFHDRSLIKADLEVLFAHLDEGIHGSISEIFEGGEPHAQRGCSAQAWSVAEAIRIWKLIK